MIVLKNELCGLNCAITKFTHPYICKSKLLDNLLVPSTNTILKINVDKLIPGPNYNRIFDLYFSSKCVNFIHYNSSWVNDCPGRYLSYIPEWVENLNNVCDYLMTPYIYENAIFLNRRLSINQNKLYFNETSKIQVFEFFPEFCQRASTEEYIDQHTIIEANQSKRCKPDSINKCINRIMECENRSCANIVGGRCNRKAFLSDVFKLKNNVQEHIQIVIAGGSLQNLFLKKLYRKKKCNSDIDLFFVGSAGMSTLNAFVIFVCSLYQKHFGNYMLINTSNSFSISSVDKFTTIQLIKRCYTDLSTLLDSFDLDGSCFAYDGRQIWTNSRGLESCVTDLNVVDLSRQSNTYAYRLCKYHKKYGLGIYDLLFNEYRVVKDYNDVYQYTFGLASILNYRSRYRLNDINPDIFKYNSGFVTKRSNTIGFLTNLERFINRIFGFGDCKTPVKITFDAMYLLKDDTDKNCFSSNFFEWNLVNNSKSFYPCNREWYIQAYGAYKLHINNDKNHNFNKILNQYVSDVCYENRTIAWSLAIPLDEVDSNGDMYIFLNHRRRICRNHLLLNTIKYLKKR